MNVEVYNLKQASKNYKKNLLGFAAFTIGMIVLVFLAFTLPINENYQVSIAMALLLLIIIGMVLFKPRLTYYKESLMYHRLKEKQGPHILTKQPLFSKSFFDKLIKQGFAKITENDSIILYSKYVKDRKQFHLRRSMLIVFAFVKQETMNYQDPSIVKQINLLEDSLYKEKKRIFNYTVYVVKEGMHLTDKIQNSCDYVTFTKAGARSIININLFYEISSKSCYFLYSDAYFPNSYYRFAVTSIKDLLN